MGSPEGLIRQSDGTGNSQEPQVELSSQTMPLGGRVHPYDIDANTAPVRRGQGFDVTGQTIITERPGKK